MEPLFRGAYATSTAFFARDIRVARNANAAHVRNENIAFNRESKLANCSGRRSAEGRDTCLAHWPQTSHECELGLEGLLLHPVPFRNFGGTRRSVDSPPRQGNNRISEASFA